jgi:hypothetical protein
MRGRDGGMGGADHEVCGKDANRTAELANPAAVPRSVSTTSLLVGGHIQALVNALQCEATSLEVANCLRGELLSRALVGLMRENHRMVGCPAPDCVHRLADRGAVGISGVNVPGDHGVATAVEVVELLLVDASVRRAEETRFNAKNLPQSGLDSVKFLTELSIRNGGNVGVEPSVRTDGVALLVRVAKVIDAILVIDAVPVITVHEEGSLGVILVVEVDNLPVPDVGTIIVRDGNTSVASGHDAGDLRAGTGASASSTGVAASTTTSEEVQIIVEIAVRDIGTSIGPTLNRGQPGVLHVIGA